MTLARSHAAELMLLERRGYLEVLWQNLPDKSKVLFNKKVADRILLKMMMASKSSSAMVPLKRGTSWLARMASTAQFERVATC